MTEIIVVFQNYKNKTLGNFDIYWAAIIAIFTGLGSFATWVFTAKPNLLKLNSEADKDSKVNSVDGDKALVEQMDFLLTKMSSFSEIILKSQEELSKEKSKNIRYRGVISNVENMCNDFSVNVDECKKKINEIKQAHGIGNE
jgi:hypothetical protein